MGVSNMINRAKWITSDLLPTMFPDNANQINQSIYMRKNFELCKSISSAELSICVLGLGVCTINGQNITEDVLSTPYTHYNKRVIYQKYDVTSLVREGKNAISIHAGNGFYNDNLPVWNDVMSPWRDRPKAIVCLDITYESGKSQTVVSDSSWKTALGPSVFNHVRQGEIYDARLRKAGYDLAGFDDANWQSAIVTFPPGGDLVWEDIVPIRITKTLSPISCKDGIYDFGINLSGWAKIRVSGEAGRKITLTYGEKLLDNGKFCQSNNMYLIQENMPVLSKNVFICSGASSEEYHPDFCYHGFRYVKVENAPDDFEIEAQLVHSDLEQIGSFWCSDEMLNRIHNASVQATVTNFVGLPTDCPHREQNGWTGDALCSADQSLMNFDMHRAYTKWLRDFGDAQRPNGQVPAVVPSAGYGFNWGCGPGWDSALILIPYKVYLHTGKTDIMSEMWPVMTKYMSFMESMSDEYIVNFGLGDWCAPNPDDVCPTEITDTAYFYADCVAMAKMATILGKDNDEWQRRANCIKKAWREKFWGKKAYSKYQTYFACAIYQELLEPEEIPDAAKSLAELVAKNGYHIDCGILGTKYIFAALSKSGYADVAYKMVVNPEFPSYAHWINNGMTTLCERWDMTFSQNHHMYSEVDNWFYRYLGGIKYTDVGLIIDPIFLSSLSEVRATHRGITVHRTGKDVTVTTPVCAKIRIDGILQDVCPGTYTFKIQAIN